MNDYEDFPLDLEDVEEECYITDDEEEEDINPCGGCPGCYI
jgi:hypothetical protein